MRIVIAYATGRLHPATRGWGEVHKAEFRELGDAEAQYRLMAELWAAGDSFLILEHDIVPACAELGLEKLEAFAELGGVCFPDQPADGCVVEALAACAEQWCLHGYPDAFTRAARPGHLACTRFSRDLIARFPRLMDECLGETGYVDGYEHLNARIDELGPRHWFRLPERISASLRRHGVREHEHEPPFAHLHDLRRLARQKLRALAEFRREALAEYRRGRDGAGDTTFSALAAALGQ